MAPETGTSWCYWWRIFNKERIQLGLVLTHWAAAFHVPVPLRMWVENSSFKYVHINMHNALVRLAVGWDSQCAMLFIECFLFRILIKGFKSCCRRQLCMFFPLTSASSKNSFLHKWQASDGRVNIVWFNGTLRLEVVPCEMPFVVLNYTLQVFSLHCVVHAWRLSVNLKREMFYFTSLRTQLISPLVGLPEWVSPKQWIRRLECALLKLPHYLQACTKNLLNKELKVLYAKTINSQPKSHVETER